MLNRVFTFFLVLGLISLSYSENYKKGEVFVKLKKGAVTTLEKKREISDGVYLVKVPGGIDVKRFIKELKSKDYVEYAEPNYIVRKVETYPNDNLFVNQWGLLKIDAPKAWDLTKGSYDIYVAVLDTGADYNHPDLRGNLWVNEDERKGNDANCHNGQDDDGNGYIDDCYGFNGYDGRGNAIDGDGHGTHIAGIIGALTNNGIGVSGVSWKVKIIPCKFLDNEGNGDINQELACIQYIKDLKDKKGLNIVALNASYGGEYSSNLEKSALEDLKNDGIFIVSASGNNGTDNDTDEFSPCNYNLENQICVGATNENDEKAWFSNYSKTKVHIYAPGKNIWSTYFDYTKTDPHLYASIDGTSQAAPFVSGGIALLKSVNPNLSYGDIKRKLMTTGDNLINLSGYSYTCNRLNLYNLINPNSSSPKICLDGLFYDFGIVNSGESKKEEFTIRSTGDGILVVSDITSDNPVFKIKDDNCSGKNLEGLEECTFKVSFEPNNSSISETGEITVISNAGTVKINVEGATNYPPEIISFTAEPTHIDVKEKVMFSWNIYDPNSDTLTCKLDFDGDGQIDKTISHCKSSTTVSIRYNEDGKYKVKLFVSDGRSQVYKTLTVKVGTGGDSGGGCFFYSKSPSGISFLFLTLIFLSYRSYRRVKTF